jgi:hypothetical protein
MRTFALYGIDVYLKTRLIALIRARTIEAAAEILDGTAREITSGRKNPGRRLYFAANAEAAVFAPGEKTAGVLASLRLEGGRAYPVEDDTEILKGYRELQLGEVPEVK